MQKKRQNTENTGNKTLTSASGRGSRETYAQRLLNRTARYLAGL